MQAWATATYLLVMMIYWVRLELTTFGVIFNSQPFNHILLISITISLQGHLSDAIVNLLWVSSIHLIPLRQRHVFISMFDMGSCCVFLHLNIFIDFAHKTHVQPTAKAITNHFYIRLSSIPFFFIASNAAESHKLWV